MSYQLSRLDLVVNNATTQITVNTNPSTQSYINGDITPSDNIIDVASTNNRFTNPDDYPATTITSTSKAPSLINLTAKALGTVNIPVAEPVGGNGLKNLITNYYDSTTYYSPQLLTCVGFNNTSTTIEDLSDNNFTITNNGTAVVSTLAPFSNSYAYASMLFNGTTQYLSITGNTSEVLNLAANAVNWTVECWFYPTSVTGDRCVFWKGGTTLSVNPSYAFFLSGTTGQWIVGDGGGGGAYQNLGTVFAINTWYHFALVRNAGFITAYINGVASTPVAVTTMSNTTNNLLTIGSSVADGSTRFFAGNISNFQVVKNVAVYKGNFTPPKNNFLPVLVSTLHSNINTTTYTKLTYEPLNINLYSSLKYTAPTGQTEVYDKTITVNSYTDAVTTNINVISSKTTVNVVSRPDFYITGSDAPNILGNNTKTTYNSLGGKFDGTTSNITVTATNGGVLDLSSTAKWTVECWFYATSLAGSGSVFWKGGGGSDNPSYAFWLSTTTPQWIVGDGTTGGISQNLSAITTNTWYHFALVRNAGFITAYINGVASTPVAVTTVGPTTSNTLWIGAAVDGRYFPGYITNFRIIKGQAIYSNNFAVPTTLLDNNIPTTILFNDVSSAQTSLLLSNQSLLNSSIYTLTITNTGSVTGSSSVFPSGLSGSLLFNGTTSRLSIPGPNSSVLDLSQGAVNWTIECWFRKTNITTDGAVFWKDGTNGSINPSYALWIQTGGQPQWIVGDGQTGNAPAFANMNYTIAANTWYHFALVRNGNYITAYINGISQSPIALGAGAIMGQQGGNLTIGAAVDSTFRYGFGGYISNFRIVKGVAVYVDSFTPPTTPLSTSVTGGTFNSVGLLTLQNYTVVDNSLYNNTMVNSGVVTLLPISPPHTTNSISSITGPYTVSTPTTPAYIRNTTKYNDPTQVEGYFNSFISEHTGEEDRVQKWV